MGGRARAASEYSMRIAFSALIIALSASPAAAATGPDGAACAAAHGPAMLVSVSGFKARTGTLRVQVYGDNPGDWLARGRKLRRIEAPVSGAGPVDVCVTLPAAGRYAVAVRHDLNGDRKSGWSDGGGFSRNPRISLLHLKPDFRDVVVPVGNGVKRVDVTMQYRSGLSIGPVRG